MSGWAGGGGKVLGREELRPSQAKLFTRFQEETKVLLREMGGRGGGEGGGQGVDYWSITTNKECHSLTILYTYKLLCTFAHASKSFIFFLLTYSDHLHCVAIVIISGDAQYIYGSNRLAQPFTALLLLLEYAYRL